MSTCQFLLELLCEEIPANALPSMRNQLVERFASQLKDAGFEGFCVRTMSTVRRVVVHVEGLPERQADREEEVTGPPVRAAYSADGSPTPAAVGFAKGQNVTVDQLRIVKGPKGDLLATTKLIKGRSTPEILAEIVKRVVPSLHFPKTMRWGAGEVSFVRPLHNIVALFGDGSLKDVVFIELLGVSSCGSTEGHRVVAPERIKIQGADGLSTYLEMLAKAGVVVDQRERRRILDEKAMALALEVECEVRPDPGLIDELVELVEHPGVLRGEIGLGFLELPEAVLITTLRHHQKCLVLTNQGQVAPYFLAVCDRPDDPEGHVRRGNEWVAGARLADAAFFFAQDRKKPLAERAPGLERVVFHQKLGSFLEKGQLIERLAKQLVADAELDISTEEIEQASRLLKVDLVTAMVGEFPELQGVMGGIYAALGGEAEVVWQAVADQYTPAGLDGALPRCVLGAVLGVADRLDTLAGMFAAGEIPSGSKDPFALRRAALAAVRVCAEFPLPIDLLSACRHAFELRRPFAKKGDEEANLEALIDFVAERERYVLTTMTSVRGEVADAVMSARWGVVPDDIARARALEAVKGEPVFEPLSLAFKRVRNMVAKGGAGVFSTQVLVEGAEKGLLEAVTKVEGEVDTQLADEDYTAALHALASLADPLESFFVSVLVLCDDEALRNARLALLARVEQLFLRIADVSRLVTSA